MALKGHGKEKKTNAHTEMTNADHLQSIGDDRVILTRTSQAAEFQTSHFQQMKVVKKGRCYDHQQTTYLHSLRHLNSYLG